MQDGIAKRVVTAVAVVVAVAVLIPGVSAGPEEEAADPWAPVEGLLGSWTGEGASFGRPTIVSHVYERVLQDQFIHMRTRSEAADGSDDHEDWGFFSWDADRERIVLRQFLTEGFVNTYVLETSADGKRLVFTSESAEGAGGTRARLTYDLRGPDEYELVLELASPGQDWLACQSMVMTSRD